MPTTTKISEVISGFRLVGLAFASFVVGGMFFGGVGSLFSPSVHPRWFGIVFLIISIPIMALTINRWVKVLAGVLGLGVVNGLLSIASGHVLANSTMSISRLDALFLTLFYGIAAVLTTTMKDRRLSLLDRISIMSFLCILAFLISYQAQLEAVKSTIFSTTAFVLMGISLCFLFLGWVSNRFHYLRGPNTRGTSAEHLT